LVLGTLFCTFGWWIFELRGGVFQKMGTLFCTSVWWIFQKKGNLTLHIRVVDFSKMGTLFCTFAWLIFQKKKREPYFSHSCGGFFKKKDCWASG